MLIEAFTATDGSFHWLDVNDPTGSELELLHKKYGLSYIALQDCLDPKHLPKYESMQEGVFIMLRAYDDKCSHDANTIRELTQKIAIFIGPDYLITIHRRDQPYIKQIRERWIKTKKNSTNILAELLGRITLAIISSYTQALTMCENDLESFETVIFKEESTSQSIQEKFLLKRKAYVFKRILKLTMDILPKLKMINDYDPSFFQDLKERSENAYFEAENILEYVNNLITLHLSLASHNTNEVVRVLTIFSVFFLPLTFIVGVYGMNFVNIPELKLEYGYPAVLTGLIIVCIILYLWFRRRGWLK